MRKAVAWITALYATGATFCAVTFALVGISMIFADQGNPYLILPFSILAAIASARYAIVHFSNIAKLIGLDEHFEKQISGRLTLVLNLIWIGAVPVYVLETVDLYGNFFNFLFPTLLILCFVPIGIIAILLILRWIRTGRISKLDV